MHSTVKIFNLEGEEIHYFPADNPDGKVSWNLSDNIQLHSGFYIYTVTGKDGNDMYGKIAVIR